MRLVLSPASLSLLAVVAVLTGCPVTPAPVDTGVPDAIESDITATDATGDVPPDARDGGLCLSHPPPSYPPGPYAVADVSTLPNLRFTNAAGRTISLGDYYQPCAATPRLLMVRNLAAWAGTARWHAEHTARVMRIPGVARTDILDLLVLNQDNLPAATRDLAPWRARYDVPPTELVIDPEYQFSPAFLEYRQVPLIVLIDTRTMHPFKFLIAPEIQALEYEIARAIALLDGVRPPRASFPPMYDGRFSEDRLDMIRAMTPIPPPPPSPTNAHADDPAAAAFGRSLFGDVRFSPSGISCATCHDPARAFDDGLPTAQGIGTTDRNTPSIVFAAYSQWQFWDGRADSLWSQALGPVENALEMGSTRLAVAHAIARLYSTEYTAIFGALPPLADTARFPASGHPGDPSWAAMSADDQNLVNAVFANFGKAIEAFERTFRTRVSALDGYAGGNLDALSPRAKDGLRQFFDGGCIQCHYGPLLTDNSFHNIAMPTGRVDGQPDRGRIDAIAVLMSSPFNANGRFSDDPTASHHLDGLAVHDSMLGQFRTPAMRANAVTGPWGHGGTFATLDEVMRHYSNRNDPTPVIGTIGRQDLHLGSFHMDANKLGSLSDVVRASTANPLLR